MDRVLLVPEGSPDSLPATVRNDLAKFGAHLRDMLLPLSVMALPCGFDQEEVGFELVDLGVPIARRQLDQVAFGGEAAAGELVHDRGDAEPTAPGTLRPDTLDAGGLPALGITNRAAPARKQAVRIGLPRILAPDHGLRGRSHALRLVRLAEQIVKTATQRLRVASEIGRAHV